MHFLGITLQLLLNYLFGYLRITDEGSVPEMVYIVNQMWFKMLHPS